MKYGKNNWARVASLLPRKSSKQCKARWMEWLDPSIKKTGWSREEDEKLLHMVKIMPTQWRSIAPIVGRTAAQCLARYDQLLEAAARADAANPEEAAAAARSAREAKRLRPGEIDPNPEVKPARPDAIDMDEDELEMLSEARARLANTKGKKAKRKAREKQLAEARRLAMLQKRRELKEAGLIRGDGSRRSNGSRSKKRDREIDYNAEVPFHTRAPAGFYDTTQEDARARDPEFKKKTRRELEGKDRAEEEMKKRKADKRKHKKLLSTNLPAHIDKVSKLNDPRNVHRRAALMLPPPQIGDEELHTVAKLTSDARRRALEAEANPGSASATRELLADPRGATPLAGSVLRPPGRTPMRRDVVIEQARSLAAMAKQQTPLVGGDSVSIDGGTGWAGGSMPTPAPILSRTGGGSGNAHLVAATPSIMSSARRQAGDAGSISTAGSEMMVSSSASEFGSTNSEFGTDDSMMEGGSMSAQRRQRLHQERERQKLRAKLAGLPEPQFTYEIDELPDDQTTDTAASGSRRKRKRDAAEIDAERIARENAIEEAKLARRSSAVKAGLPRPDKFMIAEFAMNAGKGETTSSEDDLASIVQKEALGMMWHDATAHPHAVGKIRRRVDEKPPAVGDFVEIEDGLLRRAGTLVRAEAQRDLPPPDIETFANAHSKITDQYNEAASEARSHAVAEAEQRMLHQIGKLRRKVDTLTKGHRLVSRKTLDQLLKSHSAADTLTIDLSTAHHAANMEQDAIVKESKAIDNEITQLMQEEQKFQSKYAALGIAVQ